jgi:hypothetical protein
MRRFSGGHCQQPFNWTWEEEPASGNLVRPALIPYLCAANRTTGLNATGFCMYLRLRACLRADLPAQLACALLLRRGAGGMLPMPNPPLLTTSRPRLRSVHLFGKPIKVQFAIRKIAQEDWCRSRHGRIYVAAQCESVRRQSQINSLKRARSAIALGTKRTQCARNRSTR